VSPKRNLDVAGVRSGADRGDLYRQHFPFYLSDPNLHQRWRRSQQSLRPTFSKLTFKIMLIILNATGEMNWALACRQWRYLGYETKADNSFPVSARVSNFVYLFSAVDSTYKTKQKNGRWAFRYLLSFIYSFFLFQNSADQLSLQTFPNKANWVGIPRYWYRINWNLNLEFQIISQVRSLSIQLAPRF